MNAVLQPLDTSSQAAMPHRRILLVEENAFIIELLRMVLAQDYEVLLADNATKGWAMAQRERPDAVITDLGFRDSMDGHTLLQALRADARLAHTPVLVISAHVSPADVETSLALGANAHMAKPFSPLHLLRWLEALWAEAPAHAG